MKPSALKNHYYKDVAVDYEKNRSHSRKWQAEQRVVEDLLRGLPAGTRLIDVPVGTGRFLPFYTQKNFIVEGIDISADMLGMARQQESIGNLSLTLNTGDIFALAHRDGNFDAAVCMRFLNLVSTPAMEKALTELGRVAPKAVIAGIRHLVPLQTLDLSTPEGISTLLRQIVSRITKRLQGKITLHRPEQIQSAFDKAGLTVLRKECVERRADGTEYFIYVLQRAV